MSIQFINACKCIISSNVCCVAIKRNGEKYFQVKGIKIKEITYMTSSICLCTYILLVVGVKWFLEIVNMYHTRQGGNSAVYLAVTGRHYLRKKQIGS